MTRGRLTQRRWPGAEQVAVRDSPRDRDDGGFTLVEVVVALAIITVVMTSLTVFMVNARMQGRYSALRDAAIQLAVDGMEKARAVRGSALLSGRAQCTAACAAMTATATAVLGAGVVRWDAAATGTLTLPVPGIQPDGSVVSGPGDPEISSVNGVTFSRYYYVGACYQAGVTGSASNLSCGASSAAAALIRLVVSVAWPDHSCATGTCSYSESGLFSTALTDPFIGS